MDHKHDDTKTIHSRTASNPWAAVVDVQARSQAAWEEHKTFFTDPLIQHRADSAYEIVDKFFKIHKNIYVTYRANRIHQHRVEGDPLHQHMIASGIWSTTD